MLFEVSILTTVAVLMLLAGRVNRSDKHPHVAAFLWACAITVLVWFILVWLLR
jgi:hypothetical protein